MKNFRRWFIVGWFSGAVIGVLLVSVFVTRAEEPSMTILEFQECLEQKALKNRAEFESLHGYWHNRYSEASKKAADMTNEQLWEEIDKEIEDAARRTDEELGIVEVQK